ncbi:SDR family oxidoreductase [Algihabitans sp.]|uniref:SDR family oxidoreductase n=1 Tax=Algihabitans sp. TaxID=2821514 RepID=UPI003BAD1785
MSVLGSLVPREGLRVLVTAGGSGIGRVIVEAFREARAQVYTCDVDRSILDTLDPEIGRGLADVSKPADVDALVEAATRVLGGLDVVVNNAGIAGPTAGIDEIEVADWERVIDVNLNGQYLVARRTAVHLRESQGVLLNLASVAGRLGFAFRTPYAASKWAVVGLTKSLAAELGPDGVRVNAILPGIVRGQRIERVIRDRAEALGRTYEDVERENLSKVSLRRMVDAKDIAAMALFLSAPGGGSISGQALSVCGNVETL